MRKRRTVFAWGLCFSLFFFGGTFLASPMDTACRAIEKNKKAPVFSLDVKNVSLKNVLKQISTATSYELELTGAVQNQPVTIKVEKSPLASGLKRVLANAHIRNYAIIFKEEERKIRIIVCGDGISSGNVLKESGDGAAETDIQEPVVVTKKGVVTPPSSSGSPGLTQEELDALLAKQETLSEDSIVTPPSSDGSSGLTLGELNALEAQQKDLSEDSIATPPSSDGSSGLTLGELNALEAQLKDLSEDSIATPPSSDGSRGLTLWELKQLEVQQRMIADDAVISPPSTNGSPGLTLGDLKWIEETRKTAHGSR